MLFLKYTTTTFLDFILFLLNLVSLISLNPVLFHISIASLGPLGLFPMDFYSTTAFGESDQWPHHISKKFHAFTKSVSSELRSDLSSFFYASIPVYCHIILDWLQMIHSILFSNNISFAPFGLLISIHFIHIFGLDKL